MPRYFVTLIFSSSFLQIREWKDSGSKTPMCTARPSYKSISFMQSFAYKKRLHQIKVDLGDIVFIDEDKGIVRVEPMVTIGQLNDFLIEKGWTVPVVPELDDLTVGGLVMGGGIETTSNKHGWFPDTCVNLEMVTADAEVINCSKTENPELYSAIPLSYGTLGFLASADILIQPYKPFIKMTYLPVYTLDDAVNTLDKVSRDRNEFDAVEGIMFSQDEGVIMTSEFCDTCPDYSQLNHLGRWYKPLFHRHAETALTEKRVKTEYLTTKDYMHRHNKTVFWVVDYIITFVNNPVFRFCLGWMFPLKHQVLSYLKDFVSGENFRTLILQVRIY